MKIKDKKEHLRCLQKDKPVNLRYRNDSKFNKLCIILQNAELSV